MPARLLEQVRSLPLAEQIEQVSGMKPRTSQWREEEEIPEQHWMYEIAKRFFYHDFGVYRQLGADAHSPGG